MKTVGNKLVELLHEKLEGSLRRKLDDRLRMRLTFQLYVRVRVTFSLLREVLWRRLVKN